MNCKQGDLAVVVRSRGGNLGKIVRCVRFVGKIYGWVGDDRWEVEGLLMGTFGTLHSHVRDEYLKPLRPQEDDARDETLSWKRVPSPAKQGEAA